MAKRGTTNTDTTQEKLINGKTIEQIVAENEALLQRLSAIEDSDPIALKYLATERAIKTKGKVGSEYIEVRNFADHKNISLWTKWGKRLGPMHRDNALKALSNFAAIGVSLSDTQPTENDIDAWLQSKEGKAWKVQEDKKKNDNIKTRKGASMERIMKQMAEMTGETMASLKGIFSANNVRPLSEGPGRQ